MESFRKAVGALKDSTKVGLANLNSDFKVFHNPNHDFVSFSKEFLLLLLRPTDFCSIVEGIGCCNRQGYQPRRMSPKGKARRK